MGKIKTSNKRRFNRRSKKIMRGGSEGGQGTTAGQGKPEPKPTPISKGRGAFKIRFTGEANVEEEFITRFTDILKKMDDEFIIPATLSYNLDPNDVSLCNYEGKEPEKKDSGVPKKYEGSPKTNLQNIAITTKNLAAWNRCLEPTPPSSAFKPEKLLIIASGHGGIIPEKKFIIPDNIVLCLLTRLGQYGYTNTEDRGHDFLSLSDRSPEYYENLFRDKIKRTTDMGMDEFYSYDNDKFIKNDCFANSSWYYPGQECDNMDISMSFEGEDVFRPFGIYFINPKGEAIAKDRKTFDLGNQPIDKYAEGTKLYYDKNYFSKKDTTLENITKHFNAKFGDKPVSSAKASVLLVVHCCRKLGKEKETNQSFFNDFYTQVINNYLIDNNVRETDLEKVPADEEGGVVAGPETKQLTLSLPTPNLPISNVIKKYTIGERVADQELKVKIDDKIEKYEEIKTQIVEAGPVSFSPHESLKRIEKVIDDLVSNFITILPLEEFKIRFNKLVKHPLSTAVGIPEAYGKDENINLNIEAFQTEFNRLTPLSEEIDKKIINSDIDKIATIKELINSLNIEEFVTPEDIQPTITAISELKKATTFVEIHKQISIVQEKIIYGGFRDKLRQNIIYSAKALDNGSKGYVLIKNSRDIEKIIKEGEDGKEAKWKVSDTNKIKITKAFDSFGHPIGYGEEGADDYYSDTLKYYPDDVPEYNELFKGNYSLNADNLINSIREIDESNFPVRLILETGSVTEQENMKARLRQKIDNYISLLKQQKADKQLGNFEKLKEIYEIITHNYARLRELENGFGRPEDEDIKNEIEYLNPNTLYFKRDYAKENDFIFALNNLSDIIEARILNYIDNLKFLELEDAGEIERLDRMNQKYIEEAHFKKKDSEDMSNPYFLCVNTSTFIYLAKKQNEPDSKYSDIYESYNPLCNVFTLKIYDFIKKVENLELEYDNIEKIVLNRLKTSSIGKFSILCYYFYNKSNEFDSIFNMILKYESFDKTFQDLHNKLSKGFDDVFFAKNLKIPNKDIITRPRFISLITTCKKILGIIKVAIEKIGTYYQLGERTQKIIDVIKDEIKPPQPIPVIRIKNITEYLNDFEFIVKNINYIKSCTENPVNLDGIYKTIIYNKVFNIIKRHAPHFLKSPGILQNYARYYTKKQYKLNNPDSVLNHKLLQFVKMANLLNLDLKSYGFKIETPEIAVITNKQSLDFYTTIIKEGQAVIEEQVARKDKHIIEIHINLEDSYEMEETDFKKLEELIRNEHLYKLRIIGTTYPVLYANIFEKKPSFENIIKLDLDNTFGVDLNKINEKFPNLKKIVDNRCLSAETNVLDYTIFKKLNYLEINFSNKVSSTVNIKSSAFSLKLFAVDRTTNTITINPESEITEIIIEYSDINKIEYSKDLTFLKILNSSINKILSITRLEYAEIYGGNNLVQLLDNITDKVENLTINNYVDRFMPSLPLISYTKLKKIKLNQSNIRLMGSSTKISNLPLIIEYHIPNEDVLKNLERFMKFDNIGDSKLFLIGDRQVQLYYEHRMQELEEQITSIREKIIYYPDWTRYESSF